MATIIAVIMCMMPAAVQASESKRPDPDCTSAILMDADTGKVLYEKNADAKTQPASVTKMMTALLTVENLDLDHVVTVPPEAVGILGNSMKLKVGEKLTVDQLLHALLIISANDAAVALAMEMGGSLDNFYKMMNERARQLGMKNTHYKSPNGLIEDANHYMSARDTAILAEKLMGHKSVSRIVRTVKYTLPKTNKSKARKLKNTNKMLYDTKSKITADGKKIHPRYKGTIGIKTGTMNASGYCLAAEVRRDGTNLIAVVMHANGRDGSLARYSAVIPMFDYGFSNFRNEQLVERGESVGHVKVRYGHHTFVKAVAAEGAFATLPKEADPDIASYKVVLDSGLKAPVKAGTKIGKINVYESGEKVGSYDVTVKKDVTKGGPWSAVYISDFAFILICAAVILLILILTACHMGKKKRRRMHEERVRRARQAQADTIAARRAEKRKRGWPW